MYNEEKEKREARLAGQRALASLQDARNYLRSARNWGIIDLFGGGGLSGLLKHAKVRDASRSLEQACTVHRWSPDRDRRFPDICGFLF